MNFQIKRFGLWSILRIGFCLSFILGLITGFFWAFLISVFGNLLHSNLPVQTLDFGRIGMIGFFFIPLFFGLLYGFIGAFFSLVLGVFYNLVASLIGGLELEISKKGLDKEQEERMYHWV